MTLPAEKLDALAERLSDSSRGMSKAEIDDAIGECLALINRGGRVDVMASAYTALGMAYARAERFADALRAHERAYRMAATPASTSNYVASLLHAGEVQRGLALAQEMKEVFGFLPIRLCMAVLYTMHENEAVDEAALDDLERATEIDPDVPALWGAADAFAMVGQRYRAAELAARYFERSDGPPRDGDRADVYLRKIPLEAWRERLWTERMAELVEDIRAGVPLEMLDSPRVDAEPDEIEALAEVDDRPRFSSEAARARLGL